MHLFACGGAPPASAASASPPPPSAAPRSPRDDAAVESCAAAARACAEPVVAGDFAAAVTCMPDEVVDALGGRDKLVASARGAAVQMRREGATLDVFKVEPPTQMASARGRTFAIVPTLVIVGLGESVQAEKEGFMLGVSRDGGRTWKFVDGGGVTPGLLESIYPEFPSALRLPKDVPATRRRKSP